MAFSEAEDYKPWGVIKGGSDSSPLWNEIIDYTPPPVPQGYRLYPAGLTGGGRGRVPLSLPARQVRAGGYHLGGVNSPQNPGAPFSGGIFPPRAGTRPGARSAKGFSWPAVPTAPERPSAEGFYCPARARAWPVRPRTGHAPKNFSFSLLPFLPKMCYTTIKETFVPLCTGRKKKGEDPPCTILGHML